MGEEEREGVLAGVEWVTWIVLGVVTAVHPSTATVAALGVAFLLSAGLRIWRGRRRHSGPASSR